MSSRSDLRGAIDARTPVGVVAGHLTLRQKLMTVPYYLNSGGKVFVDSGAFGAYQAKTDARCCWEVCQRICSDRLYTLCP